MVDFEMTVPSGATSEIEIGKLPGDLTVTGIEIVEVDFERVIARVEPDG
jgi:hypothetical protein